MLRFLTTSHPLNSVFSGGTFCFRLCNSGLCTRKLEWKADVQDNLFLSWQDWECSRENFKWVQSCNFLKQVFGFFEKMFVFFFLFLLFVFFLSSPTCTKFCIYHRLRYFVIFSFLLFNVLFWSFPPATILHYITLFTCHLFRPICSHLISQFLQFLYSMYYTIILYYCIGRTNEEQGVWMRRDVSNEKF